MYELFYNGKHLAGKIEFLLKTASLKKTVPEDFLSYKRRRKFGRQKRHCQWN
jgi:hypothetical protein